MGICNKAAGIISQIVLSAFVLKGINKLEDEVQAATDPAAREAILDTFASKIYVPYMIMSAILFFFAIWIMRSPLPELKASDVNTTQEGEGIKEKKSIFQFPHLWLGALCLFLYVGVEVMAGDAIGIYGKGFNIPTDETKYFTSFTLGAMLLGYIIGIITIPKYISQQKALSVSAVLGVIFTIGAFMTKGYTSVAFVAALGLANAVMWPAIFPLAIYRLGKFTETGSAILIMGIAGGAIIPRLFATLKETNDFQAVFAWLMIPCYLYILFYSIRGYNAGLSK